MRPESGIRVGQALACCLAASDHGMLAKKVCYGPFLLAPSPDTLFLSISAEICELVLLPILPTGHLVLLSSLLHPPTYKMFAFREVGPTFFFDFKIPIEKAVFGQFDMFRSTYLICSDQH